jgi:hypothetical protein
MDATDTTRRLAWEAFRAGLFVTGLVIAILTSIAAGPTEEQTVSADIYVMF